MRPWWILAVLLSVIAVWTLLQPAVHAQSASRRVPHVTRQSQSKPFTVSLDKTERRSKAEDAERDVLEKARKHVETWVREVKPDTRWTPSAAYVQKKMIRQKPVVAKEQLPAEDNTNGNGGEPQYLYSASVDLDLTPAVREEIVKKVRLEEAEGRQWVWAKGLLAALAFFGTIAGYYRLDDFTKGYYTLWLRLGAFSTLAASGWGIFLLP